MKCKYWKKCPLYDKQGVTCNKDGGMYYMDFGGRPAGCYYKMENKK